MQLHVRFSSRHDAPCRGGRQAAGRQRGGHLGLRELEAVGGGDHHRQVVLPDHVPLPELDERRQRHPCPPATARLTARSRSTAHVLHLARLRLPAVAAPAPPHAHFPSRAPTKVPSVPGGRTAGRRLPRGRGAPVWGQLSMPT